jgi:hypothetical protein
MEGTIMICFQLLPELEKTYSRIDDEKDSAC